MFLGPFALAMSAKRLAPKASLGMWTSRPLTLVAEFGWFAAGLILYWKATRSKGGWNVGFWSLAVFLAVVSLASLFGSPPPNVRVLAFSALALWLTIPWAVWGDQQREPKLQEGIADRT